MLALRVRPCQWNSFQLTRTKRALASNTPQKLAALMQDFMHGLRDECEPTIFPATRAEALRRWREFLPRASHYARLRNRVDPGHPHVTRLSVALRYRLVDEAELIESLTAQHDPRAVEKLLQEIHWRTYWKGWLEQRPAVWQDWLAARDRLLADAPPVLRRCVLEAEEGRTGVAVMDAFARELVQSGYLHNHARMWFASFWIHVLRLPWQLGADFFLRHLIDADAASNTLSWRWVAGLHTPGKCYLVRRSNVEQWTAPALLADEQGHERIDDAVVKAVPAVSEARFPRQPLRVCCPIDEVPLDAALLVHDDDLGVERSELARLRPPVIIQLTPQADHREATVKAAVRARARDDAASRLQDHFAVPVLRVTTHTQLEEALNSHCGHTLAGMTPFTGPVAPLWQELLALVAARGGRVHGCRRLHDSTHFPLARRGFFDYWKGVLASRDSN